MIFNYGQYDCNSAPLQFDGVQYSWWNDRNDVPRYFWAGNNGSAPHTCQCGLIGKCVDSGRSKCNCDSMLATPLYDEGNLTFNAVGNTKKNLRITI